MGICTQTLRYTATEAFVTLSNMQSLGREEPCLRKECMLQLL